MANKVVDKVAKVAVRIGSGGRVVIPKSYLKEQGIEEGEIVLVSLSKAKVEEVGRGLDE